MSRFDEVEYNGETVDVGAGCLWGPVRNELRKFKRSVVGGASDVGVAG